MQTGQPTRFYPKRPVFKLSFNYSGGCLGEELIGRDPSQIMIEQPDGTLCPCTSANMAALPGDTSPTLDNRISRLGSPFPSFATPCTSPLYWPLVSVGRMDMLLPN